MPNRDVVDVDVDSAIAPVEGGETTKADEVDAADAERRNTLGRWNFMVFTI